jgi:hypothetical protein
MQPDIGLGQMSDEGSIDANQTLAVIKIREAQPMLQDKIGHQG